VLTAVFLTLPIMPAFLVEISVIFAREILEACVIIGNYRKVVKAQKDKEEPWEDDQVNKSLKIIWLAAAAAATVAAVMIFALGIGLNAAGGELDDKVADVIEGVSKLVAAVCIAQLSLKIPTWLGIYPKKHEIMLGEDVTQRELWFNVAWNIWREVAEIGAFLIPFFLDEGAEAIPLSGIVGLLVGLFCGALIYAASMLLKDKRKLCIFLVVITGWLSMGLFTGGCHEIEEAVGETPKAWKIKGDFWSKSKFPMALFKPFGYTSSPTILWLVCLPVWAIILVTLHIIKYQRAKNNSEKKAAEADAEKV